MKFNFTKKLGQLLALTLLLGFTACGEDGCIKGKGTLVSQERTVSGFTKIQAEGDIEVYIKESPDFYLKIEAQDNVMEQLKTEVSGGQLRIYNKGCINNHKTIVAYVHLPKLEGVALQGSGNIHGESQFRTGDMALEISGSGDMKLDMKATNMNAYIKGSGSMKLKGEATHTDITIKGSGAIHAYDLASKTCKAEINGSGDAEVNVSEQLDVHINGSGSLYYKGNPRVQQDINGSGKVSSK